jgi:hypothetical protein
VGYITKALILFGTGGVLDLRIHFSFSMNPIRIGSFNVYVVLMHSFDATEIL